MIPAGYEPQHSTRKLLLQAHENQPLMIAFDAKRLAGFVKPPMSVIASMGISEAAHMGHRGDQEGIKYKFVNIDDTI